MPDAADFPYASPDARRLFAHLKRHCGAARLRPLLRDLGLAPVAFVAAAGELADRAWIRIVWRPLPPGAPQAATRPYTEIDRLVTTRFGRFRYRVTRRWF